MRVPARWFVEPIEVETHIGQGAYGDSYAAAVTVLGHVSGGRRLSRSSQGEEVVSDRHVMLPNPTRRIDPDTGAFIEHLDPVAVLTPESRVTARVISGTVGEVVPHVQPGTGEVVYVSAALS